MNAPLSRDQQIELMRTAEERHEAQMRARLSHAVVREVLRRSAGQVDGYQHHDVRVACCG